MSASKVKISKPAYAFCEPVSATSVPNWHIRPLSDLGRKEGGGADTLALCGREVAWDLGPADVAATLAYEQANPGRIDEYCAGCVEAYAHLSHSARSL